MIRNVARLDRLAQKRLVCHNNLWLKSFSLLTPFFNIFRSISRISSNSNLSLHVRHEIASQKIHSLQKHFECTCYDTCVDMDRQYFRRHTRVSVTWCISLMPNTHRLKSCQAVVLSKNYEQALYPLICFRKNVLLYWSRKVEKFDDLFSRINRHSCISLLHHSYVCEWPLQHLFVNIYTNYVMSQFRSLYRNAIHHIYIEHAIRQLSQLKPVVHKRIKILLVGGI